MAVVLVVMEPGSEWPGHVGDAETLVVLRSDEDMVASTRARLAALERGRQTVTVAVLACNGATDALATKRRAEVADTLLAAVSRVGWGRMVLTAAPGPSARRFRQDLLSLAGSLMDRLDGKTATVTLKFTDARAHERMVSWPRRQASTSPDRVSSLAS